MHEEGGHVSRDAEHDRKQRDAYEGAKKDFPISAARRNRDRHERDGLRVEDFDDLHIGLVVSLVHLCNEQVHVLDSGGVALGVVLS